MEPNHKYESVPQVSPSEIKHFDTDLFYPRTMATKFKEKQVKEIMESSPLVNNRPKSIPSNSDYLS